ncbi:type II toxin-antitoxin system Phd/YefM family antitoxin [Brevundimonas sp.]|jgi:prevent-host-death family protein|uniref:type II toxin-antitoxin system Phd/YefM family antitoxin n=1 Tax=Brevundimonas sp. TaxID=1871086 RepID=UPI00391CA15D|nr:type II toxin-antitoxin system Phd/YefM family antitoxin [Brevundimonas sp.]
MVETVGVFDGKARFSELIDRAERGEEIVVTRHGKPVAKVVPLGPVARRSEEVEAKMAEWRRWRAQQLADHGPTTVEEILAWRDEGRR